MAPAAEGVECDSDLIGHGHAAHTLGFEWARQDSNLDLTDYESEANCPAWL